MEKRKYAMSANKEVYINLVANTYHASVTSKLVHSVECGIVKLNDMSLFDTYVSNAIEAATDLAMCKEDYTLVLKDLFGLEDFTWDFNSYRFSITVELECDESATFPEAEKYGFKRCDLNESPAFKSTFLKFQDLMYNIFNEDYTNGARPKSVTMQLTEECNLRCTYCFQINKSPKRMSLETAKKFIDGILDDTFTNSYINPTINPSLTLEFVGGEGLLEIDLIDEILTYFYNKVANVNHPWLYKWDSFIGSNGVMYFDKRVQEVLHKWDGLLDIAITLDGDEKLHDKCRVFKDGSGSYKYAEAAVKDRLANNKGPNTKLTISPDNVHYLVDAIKNFIDLGLLHLWGNCIYEHNWTKEEAGLIYYELKEIADYMVDGGYASYIDFSIFDKEYYKPIDENEIQNWCGGDGNMLAVDTDGILYNCIRYMPSSLGADREPLSIGNVDIGIGSTKKDACNIQCMQCITRKSQSTEECFKCPIARGCSWCTAYNYQVYGTPNKRSTNTCNTHKAMALAKTYFWNRYYRSIGDMDTVENLVPFELVDGIITEQEYNIIKNI